MRLRFAIPHRDRHLGAAGRRARRRRAHPEWQPAACSSAADRPEEAAAVGLGAGHGPDQRRDRHRRRPTAAGAKADRDRLQPLRRGLDPGPARLRAGRARTDDVEDRPRTLRRRACRPRQIQSERGPARPRPLPGRRRRARLQLEQGGKPAMLLHIYGSNPVQLVFVLTFKIIRVKKGTFGTLFVARIPKSPPRSAT